MGRRVRLAVLAGIGLLLMVGGTGARAQQGSAQGQGIVGLWQGALNVFGQKLRLVVEIKAKDDGTLTGDMDSLDQGAMDLPLDVVTFEEGKVHLELKLVAGVFDGKLSEDGSEIVGEWKQGGMGLPLTLKRTTEMPTINRPQEPKPPYPYREEEVTYPNPQADITLAGTLTLPPGDGPFPAVLLITGSGAQDRNETVAGHRPFWVLADYLSRRGIAVLRVDDRGVGGSTGSMENATTQDFASDALAGVAYLKSRPEIRPDKIGLVGHSEGGLIAPIAAAQSPEVAFIGLLAGPGVSGEEILYRQGELILRASGASEEEVVWQRTLQQRLFEIIKQEQDPQAAQAKLREAVQEMLATLSEEERKAIEAQMEAQLKMVQSPWFRFFLTYDPRPTLRQVKCPLLAVSGEKDLQVPPSQNLPAIAAALEEGGNSDYTLIKLNGLNHLFQTCLTGAPGEYATIEETMSPWAMEVIYQWILRQAAK